MTSPSYFVVGALRREYILTPDGEAYLGVLGGSALYAAAGARLWSDSVGLICRVGSGWVEAGLDKLRRHELHLDSLNILEDPVEAFGFYAYPSFEEPATTNPAAHFLRIGRPLPKELMNFHRDQPAPGAKNSFLPTDIRPDDLPFEVGSARGVHLTPSGHLTHTSVAVRLRELGARRITVDASRQYMQPGEQGTLELVVNGIDAFLVGEEDALACFRPTPPGIWEMAEAFGRMGCDYVVIKRGPRGQAVLALESGQRWSVPAYPAKVKDPTGAGDAYCGGFLVGLCETADPLEAALRGSVSASIAVEGVGALHGLGCAPGLAEARLEMLRDAVERV